MKEILEELMKHLNQHATMLALALSKIEVEFHKNNERDNDPIAWVKSYFRKEDQEVTALIAALFSYGRVNQIKSTLFKIAGYLGNSPAKKIKRSNASDWTKIIGVDFKHRFNDSKDLIFLLSWIGEALRQSETLENFFTLPNSKPNEFPQLSLVELIESFTSRLTELPCTPLIYLRKPGIVFLLPLPSRKSACKRMMLFLRWVVGTGSMNLGLWNKISKSELMIPLDTHVYRISKHLGLTKRNDYSLKTAHEITESLKLLDAGDPTRFDFAICHMGISQKCPNQVTSQSCGLCHLNVFCLTAKKFKISKSDLKRTPHRRRG
jgi:uncharacterized protein (TIGR02757 family)